MLPHLVDFSDMILTVLIEALEKHLSSITISYLMLQRDAEFLSGLNRFIHLSFIPVMSLASCWV